MSESCVSSSGINFDELGQDGVMLSPEDIAWADSCLSSDPDMSDSGWNSIRDALLETLDAQHHTSPYGRNYSPEEDRMESFSSWNTVLHNVEEKAVFNIASSIETADSVQDSNTGNIHNVEEKAVVNIASSIEATDSVQDSNTCALLETLGTQYHSSPYDTDDSPSVLQPLVRETYSSEDIDGILDSDKIVVSVAATSEEEKPNNDDYLYHENNDDFWLKHNTEDVFLPTYNENLRDPGVSDPEIDFVFQDFRLEPTTEDIFMIWDFDIPPEENDFMKQLNKVLAENPLAPTPTVSDDSQAWKGLQDDSLDDLISGIADLALSPNSG